MQISPLELVGGEGVAERTFQIFVFIIGDADPEAALIQLKGWHILYQRKRKEIKIEPTATCQKVAIKNSVFRN